MNFTPRSRSRTPSPNQKIRPRSRSRSRSRSPLLHPSMAIPKTLVVFDLDYTLWPFWIDTNVTPPFRKNENGDIIDAYNEKVEYYPEVPKILQTLFDEGYVLGVASRTSEKKGAHQLLKLLDWDKFFKYKEIYPGSKLNHFSKFQLNSGIPYKYMIFFDDENRNINEIRTLGVTSILVKEGMNFEILQQGLEKFKANKPNTSKLNT